MNPILFTFLQNFFWSLIIFSSIKGYGLNTQRLLRSNLPSWVDYPLGIATFVLITGWLDYFKLCTMLALTLLCLFGLTVTLLHIKNYLKTNKLKVGINEIIMILTASSLALVTCYTPQLQGHWDDVTGYLPVCNQLMATGTSESLFSLRRALSYGGNFPLQSLGMLFTFDKGCWLYETVLGTWIFLALMLPLTKKGTFSTLIGCLALLLPMINLSSAPNTLVIILGIGIFYSRNNPLITGILFGTLISMRTQAIPYLSIIWIGLFLENLGKNGRKTAIKNSLIIATVALLFMLPFLLNNYRQFHTICYILWPGTIDPDFLHIRGNLGDCLYAFKRLLLATYLPLLLLFFATKEKSLRLFAIAGIATAFIITFMTSEYSLLEWERFSWPYLIITILPLILLWQEDKKKENKMLTLLAVVACLPYPLTNIQYNIEKTAKDIKFPGTVWEETYKTQEQIPEGASIGIFLIQSNLLNYKRNKILNFDVFPSIGNLPITNNPLNWKQWGKENHVDFLFFDHFSKETMNRYIDGLAKLNVKNYNRVWVPKRKATIETLIALQKTLPSHQTTYYTLIDLRNKESLEKNPTIWEKE